MKTPFPVVCTGAMFSRSTENSVVCSIPVCMDLHTSISYYCDEGGIFLHVETHPSDLST